MILRKDPLIKKLFLQMNIILITISIIAISYIYSLIDGNNTNIIYILIIIFALMILINMVIFIKSMKSFISKLEKVSLLIDKTMDGEEFGNSEFEDEGIFSRIGSQFSQMTRRLNMNLKDLNSEKENVKSLVTDISHQIKTPLASIKLFNTILLEENISKQEEQEFLEKTKEEVNKLEWLASSLIKVSRMEVGLIELNKENGSIEQTLRETINSVYLKALEKDIDINVEQITDININHDQKWTKEAIVNVLENAIKYLKQGGPVNINIEKLETYIKIDIEDSGIGIPNNELGKVFNRFFRGSSDIVRNSEGSGIGLYLTRKILEEQGGNIIVSSTQGQGSKFTILITI